MDKGAWQATVHGSKRVGLTECLTHTHIHTHTHIRMHYNMTMTRAKDGGKEEVSNFT